MWLIIGISITLSALALIMAMRTAPTEEENIYETWMEVTAEGELIEKELIF